MFGALVLALLNSHAVLVLNSHALQQQEQYDRVYGQSSPRPSDRRPNPILPGRSVRRTLPEYRLGDQTLGIIDLEQWVVLASTSMTSNSSGINTFVPNLAALEAVCRDVGGYLPNVTELLAGCLAGVFHSAQFNRQLPRIGLYDTTYGFSLSSTSLLRSREAAAAIYHHSVTYYGTPMRTLEDWGHYTTALQGFNVDNTVIRVSMPLGPYGDAMTPRPYCVIALNDPGPLRPERDQPFYFFLVACKKVNLPTGIDVY